MQTVVLRVLLIQAMAGLTCVIVFGVVQSGFAAVSAAYGGLIGVLTSFLLAWRMSQAAQPGADLRMLYIGAVERMLVAIAAFGVGIAVFELTPMGILVGFASTQLAYYAGAGPLRRYVMTTAAQGRRSS